MLDANEYAFASVLVMAMKFHGDPVESLSSDSQFVR